MTGSSTAAMPAVYTRSTYWKRNQRAFAPWLFLAPGIVHVPGLRDLSDLPVDLAVFFRVGRSRRKDWLGMANYVELLDDDAFYTSLKQRHLAVLYLLAMPAGLFIAIVSQPDRDRHPPLQIAVLLSLRDLSQVVVGLMFLLVLRAEFRPVVQADRVADGTGIAFWPIRHYVTYGIIAAGLWPQIAYCMILYLTGLNNISPDQIEAARLDGAKGWRMLWYVILPQLRPATFIAIVVTVIGALRSFDIVSIMTDGGPFGSSRVLSFYMYEQALSEYGYRMGYGAAIAVVLFLIMMVFITGTSSGRWSTTNGRGLNDVSETDRKGLSAAQWQIYTRSRCRLR
jgi:multiple sugar transport system permease protein